MHATTFVLRINIGRVYLYRTRVGTSYNLIFRQAVFWTILNTFQTHTFTHTYTHTAHIHRERGGEGGGNNVEEFSTA